MKSQTSGGSCLCESLDLTGVILSSLVYFCLRLPSAGIKGVSLLCADIKGMKSQVME